MKRIFIIALALLSPMPAFAQAVTATLPVTCPPSGVNCVRAQPVTNPDGTNVGAGGTYTGPAASQLPATLGAKTGANSLSVVPNSDTPFPIAGVNGTGVATVANAVPAQMVIGTVAALGRTSSTDGVSASGSLTQFGVVPFNYYYNGTTWDRVRGDATAGGWVQGSVANGTTYAGNPLPTGCYGSGTAPSAVTAGQVTRAWCALNGQSAAFLVDSTGTAVPTTNAGADGAASISGMYGAKGFTFGYNGTTWDRSRTITGAIADGTGTGVAAVEMAGSLFNNITTATTTTVKSGKGVLHKVVFNTYVASATITIYDNTAGSGTKIATITLPSSITGDVPATLPYDLQFSTGLTFVTSGATDITVVYR